MSAGSRIEWTDATWNPTTGCTPISAGCLNCYAATVAHRGMSKRHKGLTVIRDGRAVFNGTIKLHEDKLAEPLTWRKPRRVFVDSMSDLFHEAVPFEFIDRVFAVMALCPQHTFQVLTKRPERMAAYLNAEFVANRVLEAMIKLTPARGVWSWPTWKEAMGHVWLGTSVENQATADERIPHLLRCPAAVRFLSIEPLLSAIDLTSWIGDAETPHDRAFDRCPIDWMIVGGESGPHARPCNVAWIRAIVEQCRAADVPVFVKQLGTNPIGDDVCCETLGAKFTDRKGGDPSEWPEDLRVREFPRMDNVDRVDEMDEAGAAR